MSKERDREEKKNYGEKKIEIRNRLERRKKLTTIGLEREFGRKIGTASIKI